MNILRRLYRYLNRYRGWAVVAFGSMIVFALMQTVMMALVQPLFDIVLSPPSQQVIQRTHLSREQLTKQKVVDFILNRDRPEGQRGFVINAYDKVANRTSAWWRTQSRYQRSRTVLMALLIAFVIRAFT